MPSCNDPKPVSPDETTDARLRALRAWLAQVWPGAEEPQPASADASFRRYFRSRTTAGNEACDGHRIIMDAPPEHENCAPFADIAARLLTAGLHAPRIHAMDLDLGFMLLEDLGPRLYLDELNRDSAERLYGDAIDALVVMQGGVPADDLPCFITTCFERESELFTDWLLRRHAGIDDPSLHRACRRVFADLAAVLDEQPRVFVHRDYHSRNLVPVAQGARPGILDFQDAVRGPATYDLVSLTRDCYIVWPPAFRERLEERFRQRALPETDPQTFRRWCDFTATQRHLKAAGIFARLALRDGKRSYLADIPRTLGYIALAAERHEALAPLSDVLSRLTRTLPTGS